MIWPAVLVQVKGRAAPIFVKAVMDLLRHQLAETGTPIVPSSPASLTVCASAGRRRRYAAVPIDITISTARAKSVRTATLAGLVIDSPATIAPTPWSVPIASRTTPHTVVMRDRADRIRGDS